MATAAAVTAETSPRPLIRGPELRPVAALVLPGVEPATIATPMPRFAMVRPQTLLVDERYQRNLSEKSMRLIRKIVSEFSWAHFKTPVCVQTPDGLHIIDGQHTSIGCACHPQIDMIPVMIVHADSLAARARAFLGHNRDRINNTPAQIFFTAVVAEEPDAVTASQVCRRAGINILRHIPKWGHFKPRDTVAVTTIVALCNRRGAMRSRQVLQILAKAECAPITSAQIKAVELLMLDDVYKGRVDADDLTTTVVRMRVEADAKAKIVASRDDIPIWRALATVLYQETNHGRGRKAASRRG